MMVQCTDPYAEPRSRRLCRLADSQRSLAAGDDSEMVEESKLLGWSAPATEGALRGFQAASAAGIGGKDCVQMPVFWSGKPKKL